MNKSHRVPPSGIWVFGRSRTQKIQSALWIQGGAVFLIGQATQIAIFMGKMIDRRWDCYNC